MKKTWLYLYLISNLAYLNASENNEETHCEKAYITPTQVHFIENNIFIHLEDNH
jgi:hypothetical protein